MCFTLGWLENLLIWLVILAVVVGVLQLLIPWVFSMIGLNLGPLPAIIRMVVIAIVVIAVIIFVFDLLGCVLGTGMHFPRFGFVGPGLHLLQLVG